LTSLRQTLASQLRPRLRLRAMRAMTSWIQSLSQTSPARPRLSPTGTILLLTAPVVLTNAPVAPSSSPAPELRLNSAPFRVIADTLVDTSPDHHKRRGLRSLSPPAPAVKRLRHDVNVTVCHGPNANCLQPGRWLEGTLILHILRQVVALSPISMRVVDPLLVKGQPLPARFVDNLTCPPKFTAILATVHLGEAVARSIGCWPQYRQPRFVSWTRYPAPPTRPRCGRSSDTSWRPLDSKKTPKSRFSNARPKETA